MNDQCDQRVIVDIVASFDCESSIFAGENTKLNDNNKIEINSFCLVIDSR